MEPTALDQSSSTLEELLAEFHALCEREDTLRRRIERAEAERESVSPRIYEKVRAEYDAQLADVERALEPLKERLEAMRRDVEAEIERADEAIREIEERIAEAEFRARVGEYDEATLAERVREITPELEAARARRESLREKLATFDRRRRDDGSPADPPSAGSDANAADDPIAGESPDAPSEADGSRSAHAGTAAHADTAAHAGTAAHADGPAHTDAPASAPGGGNGAGAGEFVDPADWFAEDTPGGSSATSDDAAGSGGAFASAGGAGASAGGAGAPAGASIESDPLAALADPAPETSVESGATCSLEIVSGVGAGRTVPLLPMTMTIGREHDNNIEIKDPDVARYHARIVYERGRYVLEDLDGSTGTRVNDEVVARRELAGGDRIRLGSTELEFRVERG